MIHLDATPEVKAMARKVFPDYTGRKFKLDNSGRPVNVTSYWDGGSRDYFTALNLNTNQVMTVPQNGTPFDGGPIAPNGVIVPEGFMIAEHSIFCGKDTGITFYVNPKTSTGFLPPVSSLTDCERVVLEFTSRYKNTYGGETNLRFKEARRATQITVDNWDIAKSDLMREGMLTLSGAITTKGKNALGSMY